MKRIIVLWLCSVCTVHAQTPLPVVSASASSEMKDPKVLYGAAQAIDGKLNTWWTPAAPNSNGSNSWLRLELAQPSVVSGLRILGGSHYPNYPGYGDIFKLNHRLRQAKVEFSDGSSEEIVLQDVDELQYIRFKQSHSTAWLRIIPKAVYNGSKWPDLCISEAQPMGVAAKQADVEEELSAEERWRRHAIELNGLWVPNAPCTQLVYKMTTGDNGGIVRITTLGAFDASEYDVVNLEQTAEGWVVHYRTAEGQPIQKSVLAHTALHIPDVYELDAENYGKALLEKYVVGQYKNSQGEAIAISTTHITRGGRSFAYTYDAPPNMYAACGTIDLGDGPLAMRIENGDIYLYTITMAKDGPDFTVADTPYRVYYRVR